jgi:hypothetical protein
MGEMILLTVGMRCFFSVVLPVSSAETGNMGRTCELGALSVAQNC